MSARRRTNVALFEIDLGRPNRVKINGIPVRLQPMAWRLCVLLATRLGRYCSYEFIYQTLWPRRIVNNGQVYYQKRQLVKALVSVHPAAACWIETLQQSGYVLVLDPSNVVIRPED